MRIAIIEIAPNGHYTYVESLIQIYSTAIDNEIVVFTNYKGQSALKYLENKQVSFCVKEDTEGYDNFLKKVLHFDKIIVSTIESYSKELYVVAKAFEQAKFDCPIYYTIHNIDIWFGRSIISKVKNALFELPDIKKTLYQIKVQGYYSSIHDCIIKKVIRSEGKFVVLSDVLATELNRFIDKSLIAVIPFSVYDEKIIDNSRHNTKLRVCVTGAVSSIRRDYQSIFDNLNGRYHHLSKFVEWDLLGGISIDNTSEAIFEAVEKLRKQGHSIYTYNERFISMARFDTELAKADIVLGNMHLQQSSTARYGKSKETGVIFTIIKAAKVGILPKGYDYDNRLSSSILKFDTYENLMSILESLAKDTDLLLKLKKEAKNNAQLYSPIYVYETLEKSI